MATTARPAPLYAGDEWVTNWPGIAALHQRLDALDMADTLDAARNLAGDLPDLVRQAGREVLPHLLDTAGDSRDLVALNTAAQGLNDRLAGAAGAAGEAVLGALRVEDVPMLRRLVRAMDV